MTTDAGIQPKHLTSATAVAERELKELRSGKQGKRLMKLLGAQLQEKLDRGELRNEAEARDIFEERIRPALVEILKIKTGWYFRALVLLDSAEKRE